ncbi:hypothetical protein Namu_4624 [Nakamurella multipartita DSM 44233]|uniref:Uncharacterized protein n=1 Tax=Nakamurella multipartita (strain ATCC 700099 / DSM 44233 / CIP 104796 / JCM 9543 / NBRC 105858 / Y-104) TaxID=479431 RepID=C8X705_NAKMY|nr:hypothetical protein Namu_4624 [Nakamurella multipartita DSM 44233]
MSRSDLEGNIQNAIASKAPLIWVTGDAGTGKTSVVQHLLAAVSNSVTIRAHTPALLHDDLAIALEQSSLSSEGHLAALALRLAKSLVPLRRSIIVYVDNANDLTVSGQVIEVMLDSGIQVIATSQTRSPFPNAATVDVHDMSVTEAVALVISIVPECTEVVALAVATTLYCRPLAIDHACRAAVQYGLEIRRFCTEIRSDADLAKALELSAPAPEVALTAVYRRVLNRLAAQQDTHLLLEIIVHTEFYIAAEPLDRVWLAARNESPVAPAASDTLADDIAAQVRWGATIIAPAPSSESPRMPLLSQLALRQAINVLTNLNLVHFRQNVYMIHDLTRAVLRSLTPVNRHAVARAIGNAILGEVKEWYWVPGDPLPAKIALQAVQIGFALQAIAEEPPETTAELDTHEFLTAVALRSFRQLGDNLAGTADIVDTNLQAQQRFNSSEIRPGLRAMSIECFARGWVTQSFRPRMDSSYFDVIKVNAEEADAIRGFSSSGWDNLHAEVDYTTMTRTAESVKLHLNTHDLRRHSFDDLIRLAKRSAVIGMCEISTGRTLQGVSTLRECIERFRTIGCLPASAAWGMRCTIAAVQGSLRAGRLDLVDELLRDNLAKFMAWYDLRLGVSPRRFRLLDIPMFERVRAILREYNIAKHLYDPQYGQYVIDEELRRTMVDCERWATSVEGGLSFDFGEQRSRLFPFSSIDDVPEHQVGEMHQFEKSLAESKHSTFGISQIALNSLVGFVLMYVDGVRPEDLALSNSGQASEESQAVHAMFERPWLMPLTVRNIAWKFKHDHHSPYWYARSMAIAACASNLDGVRAGLRRRLVAEGRRVSGRLGRKDWLQAIDASVGSQPELRCFVAI